MADASFVLHTRNAQVELATDPPNEALAQQIDDALSADSEITDLWWHMTRQADMAWAGPYMNEEMRARRVQKYTHTIPGMLQTETYARVALRSGLPHITDEELERRVQAPEPLALWSVLDEAALRRPVGSAEIMREQLSHLLAMADHPQVTLQVLEFKAGHHGAMGGALSILSFNDAPELLYLEGMSVGSLVQSSVDVTRYLSIYNLIQVHALLPDATKDLIKQIMEDDHPCEPGHLA